MDIRDPNIFDMMMQGDKGIGNQIRVIAGNTRTHVKICEMEINMEAPDADAEILTAFTVIFTGAAKNVDTITAVADVAGSLNDTYFWFYIGSTQNYCWFNVNAAGTDPSVAGTAREVALATNDNAATVGAAVQAVIDALASVTSAGTSPFTINQDANGVVTAAAYDGSVPTGFTFVNTIAGTAAYTPNYFYAISNNVKDTSAGVGTRTIRVFIIDENGVPGYTDIIMAGTTAVKSSVKASAIYGAIGLTAGSEADTAGTLTIQEWLTTDVYCTIAAAGMGSVSARCWVPASWNCKIGDIRSEVMEVSHANVDIILDLGAILTPIVASEPSGVGHDILEQLVIAHLNSPHYRNDIGLIADGGNGAYYTINHVTKADDANTTLYTKIRYILWSD